MTLNPFDLIPLNNEGEYSLFSLLPNWQGYAIHKEKIDERIRKLLKASITQIDTIVTGDRKGTNILTDFLFDNPHLNKFNIATDNRWRWESKSQIRGMKILIFDDSVHSGRTIIKLVKKLYRGGAKEISIACLLINQKAIRSIRREFPHIKIHPIIMPFTKYGAQQKYYTTELIGYLSGIRNKRNPDFPILKFRLAFGDKTKLQTLIESVLRRHYPIIEIITIDSIADKKGAISVTVEFDPNSIFSKRLKDIIRTELPDLSAKMRFNIIATNAHCDITFTSIFSPHFLIDKCRIDKTKPGLCQYKLSKETTKSQKKCGICLPYLTNMLFLMDLKTTLETSFRESHVFIEKSEYDGPSPGRFWG